MRYLLLSAAVMALWSADAARAAEITLIAPGGFRAAVEQMIPVFERQTGHKVKATIGSGGGTKERVVKGELFDVPVVQPPLAPVLASGHVVKESEMLLANVWVGMAVKAGAPRPDISTADAVRRTLLAAKSIAYPNVEGSPAGGAAGVSMNETLQRLGIADAMKPKIKGAPNGAGAMAMTAKGDVELGFTYISEIITEPGIDLVGPLPKDASTPTGLVGFVHAHSKEPAAAKALLAYLAGPEAAKVYKERGMEPGH
jgi:molybdate transport system substrate-binding protein